jgi:hypothetical protein
MGDELWSSIQDGDFEAATEQANRTCDLLDLVLAGIGWGDGGEATELAMPPDQAQRAFAHLQLEYRGQQLAKDERDAIYGALVQHLPGMGDLWIFVRRGDHEKATSLAREFVDLLQLVTAGLGWGEDGPAVELCLPDETVRRIFGYLHELTARARAKEERLEAETREEAKEAATTATLVLGACQRVNTEIDVRAMSAAPNRRHSRAG